MVKLLKQSSIFPFLFGGAFIEASPHTYTPSAKDFPSFSEGLSLRPRTLLPARYRYSYFPSFSEGLSLRLGKRRGSASSARNFPSFSEGLSLRHRAITRPYEAILDFPSFSEGLSLRQTTDATLDAVIFLFPFLFGGAFIEAERRSPYEWCNR